MQILYLVLVLGPRKNLVKAAIRPPSPLHRVLEFAGAYPLALRLLGPFRLSGTSP